MMDCITLGLPRSAPPTIRWAVRGSQGQAGQNSQPSPDWDAGYRNVYETDTLYKAP